MAEWTPVVEYRLDRSPRPVARASASREASAPTLAGARTRGSRLLTRARGFSPLVERVDPRYPTPAPSGAVNRDDPHSSLGPSSLFLHGSIRSRCRFPRREGSPRRCQSAKRIVPSSQPRPSRAWNSPPMRSDGCQWPPGPGLRARPRRHAPAALLGAVNSIHSDASVAKRAPTRPTPGFPPDVGARTPDPAT